MLSSTQKVPPPPIITSSRSKSPPSVKQRRARASCIAQASVWSPRTRRMIDLGQDRGLRLLYGRRSSSAWKEGPKEEGIAMNSLFKLSLAALAMSGIVGLGPNLASARDTKQNGSVLAALWPLVRTMDCCSWYRSDGDPTRKR
jgi:hypothetical protein